MKMDQKQTISAGMAVCSIFVLLGAIFGLWGLIAPLALYFLASSAQQ